MAYLGLSIQLVCLDVGLWGPFGLEIQEELPALHCLLSSQRFQKSLIKEYALNHIGILIRI